MTPHKFTILEVSPQCYAEIAAALRSHDARHCVADTGSEVIDMSGIAIQPSAHLFGTAPCVECARLIAHTMRSANAVKGQAHVERPEERRQQKETEHVV